MKKMILITLLLALLATVSLSALGETASPQGDVDMQRYEEIIAANSCENLLSRHGNAYAEKKIYKPDGTYTYENIFADAENYYLASEYFQWGILSSPDRYIEFYWNESDPSFYLYDSPDRYQQQFTSMWAEFPIDIQPGEYPYQIEEGDGLVKVYTRIDDQDFVHSLYEDSEIVPDGFKYQEGLVIQRVLTFDAATLDPVRYELKLLYPDGTECLSQQYEFRYDVEIGDTDGYLVGYYDASANSRMVAITFAPGTDGEHTEEYMVAKGAYFYAMQGDEFAEAYYIDPECTQEFGKSDGMQDLHLYVK